MIITISADLHEDINTIKEMIEKHYETNLPVLGIYKKRHATLLKNFCSKFYYFFLNKIGIKIIKHHADFRLISFKIKSNLFNKLESFIFIRIKILELIDKFTTIEYIGNDRSAGKSKFNFFSSSLLAFDSIIFYSKVSIFKFLNMIIFIKIFIMILLNLIFNNFLFVFNLIFLVFILLVIFINIIVFYRLKFLKIKNNFFEVKDLIK